MKIRYVGTATVRIVGPLEWRPSNNYVCEVGAETAADLLSYPRPDFVVDAGEPLLTIRGLDAERVAALALTGIGTVSDVATIEDAARLANVLRVRVAEVEAWITQARSLLAATAPILVEMLG